MFSQDFVNCSVIIELALYIYMYIYGCNLQRDLSTTTDVKGEKILGREVFIVQNKTRKDPHPLLRLVVETKTT